MVEYGLRGSMFHVMGPTTVYDFDFAGIGDFSTDDDFVGGAIYTENGTFSSGTTTIGYNESAIATDVTTDNGVVSVYPWFHWVTLFTDTDPGFITDFTFGVNQQGQNMLFGIWGHSSSLDWLVDNLRIYNMVTTLEEGKSKAPGRIVRPNKKSKKSRKSLARQMPGPTNLKPVK